MTAGWEERDQNSAPLERMFSQLSLEVTFLCFKCLCKIYIYIFVVLGLELRAYTLSHSTSPLW
jgi:hypothetical protein